MSQEYAITDGLVNTYFDTVTAVDGRPLSLLVPTDAGRHTFPLVAAALKQMEGQLFDLAILVTTIQSDNTVYQAAGKVITPLGALEIHQEAARALGEKFPEISAVKPDNIQQSDLIAESFPVLLSFLKHVTPYTKVLPVLMPHNALDLASSIGKFLSEMFAGRQAVMIAQADLDQPMLASLEFNDPQIFKQTGKLIERQRQENPNLPEISSGAAAAALAYANESGGNTVSILQEHYRENLVSSAVMLWDYQPPQLSDDQKQELVQLASQAIESYVIEGVMPDFQSDDPKLNRKAGVFVTIRNKGMLRGCIGHMSAERPLGKAVQEMAIAAATSDPRFPPLTKQEIEQITTKIAILSPMKRINHQEVEVGKHGLLISHGGRRGVLLPEVASDRNWDKETFLENLCRKAGLPADTWRQNPTLYAFTSVVFGNE
jgi:AmmeMemoRadiSam system protein A/AmmeMemoRadiSam system protein B